MRRLAYNAPICQREKIWFSRRASRNLVCPAARQSLSFKDVYPGKMIPVTHVPPPSVLCMHNDVCVWCYSTFKDCLQPNVQVVLLGSWWILTAVGFPSFSSLTANDKRAFLAAVTTAAADVFPFLCQVCKKACVCARMLIHHRIRQQHSRFVWHSNSAACHAAQNRQLQSTGLDLQRSTKRSCWLSSRLNHSLLLFENHLVTDHWCPIPLL